MSDEREQLEDLEALLRQMPLRRPSDMLETRIQQTIEGGRRWERWLRAGLASAVAAAATILLVLWQPWDVAGTGVKMAGGSHPTQGNPTQVTQTTQPAIAGPIQITQETADDYTDDGIVGLEGQTPLRRYRRQVVEQVWVIDPAKKTKLHMTIPREEVVLVRSEPY